MAVSQKAISSSSQRKQGTLVAVRRGAHGLVCKALGPGEGKGTVFVVHPLDLLPTMSDPVIAAAHGLSTRQVTLAGNPLSATFTLLRKSPNVAFSGVNITPFSVPDSGLNTQSVCRSGVPYETGEGRVEERGVAEEGKEVEGNTAQHPEYLSDLLGLGLFVIVALLVPGTFFLRHGPHRPKPGIQPAWGRGTRGFDCWIGGGGALAPTYQVDLAVCYVSWPRLLPPLASG